MSSKKPSLDSRIQSLLSAATLEELRSALVPILHELSYHATVVGGGAETLDEWREECTDYLYSETARDYAADQLRRESREIERGLRGGTPPGPEAYQQPPPRNRPEPADIPPSLRAILDGASPDRGGDPAGGMP